MNGRDIPSRAIIKLLRQIGYKPPQNVRAIWKANESNQTVAELERMYKLRSKEVL